jgi:glycosyltransferase involved in cell wall biosynthesis
VIVLYENKVFLVTYGIAPESSGVTNATLNQSKMFTDANYDVSITTFDYKPNYRQIFEELKSMNRVYEDISHINKYQYYAELNNPTGIINTGFYDAEFSFYEDGFTSYFDKDAENVVHFFKDGELVKTKTYDKGQFLQAVDYYNSSKEIVRRWEFSEDRYPIMQQFFSERTGNISRESFYTSDGFCFLTRHHKEDGAPGEVFLFKRDDNSAQRFNGNKAHDKHWLNELALKHKISNKLPIFIANGQGSGTKVMGIPKKHAKRTFFVHNNHLGKPYTYGSDIKKRYEYVFNNIKKLDALIVLTEKQKQDIQRQFGKHENIYVIPNAISITEHEPEQKEEATVIMVTRLEGQKNLKKAIKIFPQVVKEVPNAKLNIFGKGKLEEELQEYIKENGMNNHIFLKGYSRNIKKEIKKSNLSLLTSHYEGLPLAAVEALENETPVVSYDFNYGASDIIKDKETGYVIDLGNEEEMASKVVYLLKNPQVANKMGQAGRKDMIMRYSSEVVYQKWMEMLKKLESAEQSVIK